MKKYFSNPWLTIYSVRRLGLWAMASLAFVLNLSACDKHDDGKTVGQKLDSAISRTEQAAAEAKVKTESTMVNAGVALKEAAQQAENSGKKTASKTVEEFGDIGITAAVTGGLAKDPNLSAFKIDVDTKSGTVVLRGSAPTNSAREEAGNIAKNVKGVISVNNQLTVGAN